MTLRRVAALGIALLLLAAACTAEPPIPDREPDVTGVVAGADGPGGPVLAEPSDGYFEGMSLLRGNPVVVGSDGAVVPVLTIEDGDAVEVWIDGPCAESFPVQCDVTALRLRG